LRRHSSRNSTYCLTFSFFAPQNINVGDIGVPVCGFRLLKAATFIVCPDFTLLEFVRCLVFIVMVEYLQLLYLIFWLVDSVFIGTQAVPNVARPVSIRNCNIKILLHEIR